MDKMENQETVLKVKDLCKGTILKNVSFSMASGEMTAVMGPSGSGKSTLLYQVSGMDKADGGEVWIGKTQITGLNEEEKAAFRLRHIGFVFQQMNMLSNLNILDNILLPARQKKSREKEDAYARQLMEKLSISDLGDRRISQVSGGQLQRACICRSMINHPELILADEPTGALNQKAAAEVMDTFVALNREGATILMVTHDRVVASKCQRVLYLVDGEIIGELKLGKLEPGTEKDREERLGQWLTALAW